MVEEMIDIVNERNEVIGSAPRKGIHGTGLRHRSVHIFLIDSKGRIWLEKRAGSTDTYPGYYNSSAAGHVSRGETYLQGAQREVEEELGMRGLKLDERRLLQASSETSNEFVMFYTAKSDKSPRKHEMTDSLIPCSVKEIDRMIADGERFVPIFLLLYGWSKENGLL